MSGLSILLVILVYFSILLLISYLVGRKSTDNDAFFLGNKKSPWWVVAIGMIGSSISGVSFVSVPGMVRGIDFTYMQTVIGFFVGYLVIANVLLPLYYKLNLTSIYTYLEQRFGKYTYKTGASFFLLSRTIGSGVRLYLVTLILQLIVFDAWHIPFVVTASGTVFFIWLYTHRSGIKTIVWTDTLQTICLISALVLMVIQVSKQLNFSSGDFIHSMVNYSHSRIFVFDDWHSKQNFFKQFFSGIFIAIVMTGLDQDMMQKNLTCKSLKESQKNMLTFSAIFVFVVALFLLLGVLLYLFADANGISLPSKSDYLFPMLALNHMNIMIGVFFLLGITAANYASADSALTSLTTAFCVDFLDIKNRPQERKQSLLRRTHIAFSLLLFVVIMIFRIINDQSVVVAVFKAAGYTYGPLLGLFAFGLLTKKQVKDRWVPLITICSPFIAWIIDALSEQMFNGYQIGFELIIINGAITFAGLSIIQKKNSLSLKNVNK